ncbi:Krr1-domain-containing protein [Polyplosphaeria fusca]|uniref:Krr1-domain-containing protein n=1 Tax=Polyplosphaeria fusca TaxID=682080 RepID=A0A9P4QXC1_9PLEO|nr:Krr1-domain-containing protein [Polyplosphaeria fusca]
MSDNLDERPVKKARLLDDSDESESDEGGVSLKVNEEYAQRFEHNKKREDKQRLEEKYGKRAVANDEESDDDSEEGVSEDDEGEFATEAVDAEISATLQAIRSKDPRVYDKSATFFRELDEDDDGRPSRPKKDESMTLKQYHTRNLLGEGAGEEDTEDAPFNTYAQEQEETRQNLIKETNAAMTSDNEDNEDFLVAKAKPKKKPSVRVTEADVENADKDPETFLSNFLAARAWVPTSESHWKPLESDDEEEEARADDFENAYNMYFEDPAEANEKIVTYARDVVNSKSVRRDELSGRKKAREAARAKREAEKREREEEISRLRKYKIEEMEDKVKKIRKTAGLTGRDFQMNDWADVLEADWSDEQWEDEMRKRFGDAYYDALEGVEGSGSDAEAGTTKKKPKKPKWDDDIDINDLVPDFEEDDNEKPAFTLSSDDEDADAAGEPDSDEDQPTKSKSSKQRKKDRADAKSSARRDRRLIEQLVDSNLQYEKSFASDPKVPSKFRYREVSPTDFGMTSRDILLANDTQLNQFAGLKKLASFRDSAKKKKDKKALSKKARLRQWRLETFGNEEGPKGGFEVLVGEDGEDGDVAPSRKKANDGVDIREGDGNKKRKRNKKKRKSAAVEA